MIVQHLKLRRATLFDANKIFEIEIKSFSHRTAALKEEIEKAIVENKIYIYDICQQTVGYIWIEITNDVCYIESIAVDSDHRGKSYGKEILERTLLMLKEDAIIKCVLHVNTTNKIAYHMYKEFGFSNLHLVENFYGENSNAYLMEKIL